MRAKEMDLLEEDDSSGSIDFDTLRKRLNDLKLHWAGLVTALLMGGGAGFAVSFAFTPTYLSSTLFIPPQQQSGAAAALANLGALTTLTGGSAGKSSVDQYVSMLQSNTVADSVINHFDLAKLYGTKFKDDTRKKLGQRVQISTGKKDGMIRIDAEDVDPNRAAAIADQYVEELRVMTSRLAVTEAQQRRVLFEHLLEATKQKLTNAQIAMEGTGLDAGLLKSDPKSAADTYAKLRADLTAAQVRLQVAKGSLADTAPEVLQEQRRVDALGSQLSRLEATQTTDNSSPGYVTKYREFKYQETLFDLYSKDYELARLDEAREGALIQVVDQAEPAERRHFPRRRLFTLVSGVLAILVMAVWFWFRDDRSRRYQSADATRSVN